MTARVGVCVVAYGRSPEWEKEIRRAFTKTAHQEIAVHVRHNDRDQNGLSICKNELALEGGEPYLMFCNDDVLPSPGWDDRLVGFLEEDSTCGAILPIPVGDSRHPEAWRPFVSGDPGRPTAENLARLAKELEKAPRVVKYDPMHNASVFFAVMMKRDTWEMLKGFDERFRFYGSDRDLMKRLRSFNLWVGGTPRCPFWHASGESTKANSAFSYKLEWKTRTRVLEALGRNQIVRWHQMSDTDRAAVRRDPFLSKIGAAAPSLSIIIPTLGRPSLKNTLESVVWQLHPLDEVIVVGDGPQRGARTLAQDAGARYEETPTTNSWGHAQRNRGMDSANGDFVMFLDDDDVAAPQALQSVRNAVLEDPDTPCIFRMSYKGKIIWTTPGIRLGNVSTHMYVFPNRKDRLARWKAAPDSPNGSGGDYHWLRETAALWPKGSLRWKEDPIAILTQHRKGAVL